LAFRAAVNSTFKLFDRATSHLLALLDSPELTARQISAADLLAVVKVAEIIYCATWALDPLTRRARVFVDTPSALIEAGGNCVPLTWGIIAETGIQGDLFWLE
jgi:ornithine cyclodeaminase/alanine dehydrogenase-like protein (mu-crystallin family)